MDQRHVTQRLVDPLETVRDRQNEAGRQLPQRAPGVHQGRAVGLEFSTRHDFIEGACSLLHTLFTRAVPCIDLRDDPGDAPEHLGG